MECYGNIWASFLAFETVIFKFMGRNFMSKNCYVTYVIFIKMARILFVDRRYKKQLFKFFFHGRNYWMLEIYTAPKMKFSIKNFFSKCDQICNFLWIWSPLLKKFLMENLIFCAVLIDEIFICWFVTYITVVRLQCKCTRRYFLVLISNKQILKQRSHFNDLHIRVFGWLNFLIGSSPWI